MTDRDYWIRTLLMIGDPLLEACKQRELKARLPQQGPEDRQRFASLEAVGRYLAGMAPWLELEADDTEEGKLRARYGELAREAIDAISDPKSPDFALWHGGDADDPRAQPLVDASFLALAIVRAPNALWHALAPRVQSNLIEQFHTSKKILPGQNNWLLFGAMMDVALREMGEEWDSMRIDYALRKHMDWYVGDGVYQDGNWFAADYYNSFVIQPYLVDVIRRMDGVEWRWNGILEMIMQRARRYAEQQERIISPEGTFPPLGRSLTYRFGAFHALAQIAFLKELPESLPPAQVRSALSAVIRRMMDMPGNFDELGWLNIGFCGHQPELGERYITVGSQYLCSTVFLPLGLSEDDVFWAGDAMPWTSQRLFGGESLPAEVALEKRKSF